MKLFNKIAIIGVGLIGGSIGLAAKQKKLAEQIVGVCRHQSSLRQAKQIGAVDQGSLSYPDAVKGRDLIILATPIKQIMGIAKEIAPFLKPGCIITDVGSTKQEIVRQIEKSLPKGVYFVGAHPLAGSENRGVSWARPDLFKNTICFLTPTKKVKPQALRKVASFWQRLGCRIKILSAERHDQIVALISHLPHLVAVELVKVARRHLAFAGRGFFDTTRIASSQAEIWTDIFLTNKRFILNALENYIAQLKLTQDLIRKGDRKRLSKEFRKIKALRDALQK